MTKLQKIGFSVFFTIIGLFAIVGNTTSIVGSAGNSYLLEDYATVVSAAGTTTLTTASKTNLIVSGGTTQIVVLPAANTLKLGRLFQIHNRSSGVVTVNANGGGLLKALKSLENREFRVTNIGSGAGTWDVSFLPVPFAGDSGIGGIQGLVPSPAAGDGAASKFLHANGTWQVPAGAGTVTSVDMTVPTNFAIAGNPVVGAGTLALTLPGGVHNDSTTFTNCSIGVSSAGSTLAVNLLDQAAGTPSASSPCKIGFRNSTVTTGSYSVASFTGAAAITLGTTDSLAFVTTVANELNVYVIDDGTDEVCLSKYSFDESALQSATALTGGAEVSGVLLYCTSAHTSKPIRRIGKIIGVWTNAVGWTFSNASVLPSTVPSNYLTSNFPDNNPPAAAAAYGDANSLSVTPGSWVIYAHAYFRNGAITTATNALNGISTTSGNSSTGLDDTFNTCQLSPMKSLAANAIEYCHVTIAVRVLSTTTYYQKILVGGSTTNLAVGANLSAIRVGD